MTLDPLPADIEVGDPWHANLHNQERDRINAVAALLNGSEAIPALPWLHAVPVFVYGDSYTRYAPPEATPHHRIARRYQMGEPVNRGVSGTRCSQIYEQIEATWTPNTRGYVGIGSATINNVREFPATEDGYITGAEAFRACLAYLSAREVTPFGDTGTPTRFGPSWTYDAAKDAWVNTATPGAYVDIAWTGAKKLDLFCLFEDGAGGTFEVLDEAGDIVAFANTGTYEEDFTGVVTVPSQGAGDHTVRLVVTAGNVGLRLVGVRASDPPLIVWDKPAEILLGEVPAAELEEANVYMQDVADAFPNVVTADNQRAGWNPATMLSDDLAHRNDRGNAFATDTIDAALNGALTDYDQGLNAVTDYYGDPDGYELPAADYAAVGAAVPAAPVLVATAANMVKTSWTRPNDNGATLTGYQLQYRTTAGPGAWTTITNPSAAAVAHLIEAGLVAATSYDFRIRAANAIGDGAWSNTVTPVIAGAAPTYYSRDDFDTPVALGFGTADVGGAWTAYNCTGAVDATGAKITGKTAATNWAHVTVTDAQKDGYASVVLEDSFGSSAGVIMCSNSPTAPTSAVALVSYIPTNQYALMFQINATTWVVRTLYNIVPQPGDRVGIHKAGNVYTPVINGVPQASESSGLSDLTSTRHGVIAFLAGARFSDYAHSNVNPLL